MQTHAQVTSKILRQKKITKLSLSVIITVVSAEVHSDPI
jgi:hypothetical protein